jgi:prepilin-type N-terminal cleavage/methylation domain-containing protein
MKPAPQKTGFSLTELIVALSVLGLMLSLFGKSLYQTRTFSHALWTQQHCIAAAQATLDSLSARQPLAQADAKRLWPRIELATTQTPGQGPWQGLTLVTVRASGPSYRHPIHVTLSRYMDQPIPESGGDS